MTESTNDNREIKLPGYKLQKMLGAGGYGEVWLADAPGGLTKAVKIIFGFHNEKRASSELRSLEKIKAVRHPFLLSLERIEVIEDRLVIVTELADGSLQDRFNHFAEQGQPGIPREELLGYLRDSADALDYLSNNHSLQHLDIKPENLLLLAGHVKVADFGLVKQIQDTQASLVGGMTPLYSAPEVFQGTPTSYSDQYSLAVLYQEMLTGKPPFSGTNSAELTLQHMHDDPDLSPLPLADRYVLARALSKNPQQRYTSCRELVNALLKVDQESTSGGSDWQPRPIASPTAPSSEVAESVKSRPGTMTQVFDDELVEDKNQLSDSMLIELPESADEAADPPPALDLQASDARPTPTLVIGIGGTAGHVLSGIRSRLNSRFGADCAIPAVQLLLLDTDKKSLLENTHRTGDAGLTAEETLALQLRRPQEYRDHSKRLLGWLSRRWLYNIPKSLRTEGLRPLGRLAFADHARRAIQRIRLALSNAMDDNALAESSDQTGLTFDGQSVRVYVVASISGGTGSGMSIDIGYAVRSLLEKLGIEHATTTGIMLHSTGRDSRYCDLAKVNAFSWFKEYQHFSRPEGYYPGDEASGLPALPTGTPVFDNTYFLSLGDGLSSEQLKKNADVVAQYFMLDALTSANKFFEASRSALPATVGDLPSLRTFGVFEQQLASEQMLDELTNQLCQRVVLGWSGSEQDTSSKSTRESQLAYDVETASVSDTSHIICGAPRAVASLQLNLEGISANARSILEGQFGTDVEQMLATLLEVAAAESQDFTSAEVLKLVDDLFAAEPGTETADRNYVNGRRLDSIVSPLGMKLAADLQRWLLHRLDEGQERLAGTQQAAEWFAQHLQRVEVDSARLSRGISTKLVAMVNEYRGQQDAPSKQARVDSPAGQLELAIKYFRLRLDLSALQATGHLVRMLQSELKNLREAIVEFGRHIRHLADKLASSSESDQLKTFGEDSGRSNDPISVALRSKLPEMSAEVDQQLQQQVINPQGGLFQTVMGNRKVMSQLLDALRWTAKEQVIAAARELSRAGAGNTDEETFRGYAHEASSPLLALGGVSTNLAVLPQKRDSANSVQTVRQSLGAETSILTGVGENLTLCSEVGQLPLARVAVDLIECRRDYAEFADRVHTRNDVAWAPLIDSKKSSTSNTSEYATQVLSQAL